MTDKGKEPAVSAVPADTAAAPTDTVAPAAKKAITIRLLVEGWTKYSHSYAYVNLCQLVVMAKYAAQHPDELELYFRETAPFSPTWPVLDSAFPSMLSRDEDALVKAIKRYPDDSEKDKPKIDVIFRMGFGHDLTIPTDPIETKVVVFFTAEFGKLTQENFASKEPHRFELFCSLMRAGLFFAVTPSRWNVRCFLKDGAEQNGLDVGPAMRRYVHSDRVAIVPHGVDTTKFYPDAEGRKKLRARLGLGPADCAFLHVGAMTMNKNVLHILKSFYDTAVHNDNAHLILKCISTMYNSSAQIGSYMKHLVEQGHIDGKVWEENVGKRVHIVDGNLDIDSMRWLYSACDCYVAPYMGEGFNLPVLEAMACGAPLIVTRGGATDDFVHPECAMFLESRLVDAPSPGGKWLETSHAELTHHMTKMASGEDGGLTMAAQNVGPEHVQKNFTWEIVTMHLLEFLCRVVTIRVD